MIEFVCRDDDVRHRQHLRPYFDAAIAVSPKVVQDLLSSDGPITVSSTKTTFTADNFLVQVQKIVQAGQASSATYPKQMFAI